MKIISVLLMVCFLCGCVTVFHRGGNSSMGELTRQDRMEIEAGDMIHSHIVSGFPLYNDKDAVRYVREVGFSLVPQVKRRYLPYDFFVLYDDRIYATSAPGGRVYITTGFLNLLETESELAAVLAHELAQVQYCPPDPEMKQFYKDARPLLTAFLTVLSPAFGGVAVMAMDGVAYYQFLEKTRPERTISADTQALHYLLDAGYDPQGVIDSMYRLIRLDEDHVMKLSNYNISHPITNQRFEAMQDAYAQLDLTGRTFESGYARFQSAMRDLKIAYARTNRRTVINA